MPPTWMVTTADSKDGDPVEAHGAVVLGALREEPLPLLRVRSLRDLSAATLGMTSSWTSASAASTLALIFAHVFFRSGLWHFELELRKSCIKDTWQD